MYYALQLWLNHPLNGCFAVVLALHFLVIHLSHWITRIYKDKQQNDGAATTATTAVTNTDMIVRDKKTDFNNADEVLGRKIDAWEKRKAEWKDIMLKLDSEDSVFKGKCEAGERIWRG